jgi:hypothetical protein
MIPKLLWVFILVTVVMGGGAAWMTGRAIALIWRGWLSCVGALFLLTFPVRFIHYALFGEPLLSLSGFLSSFCVLLVIGIAGWRYTRASQMVRQYHWLYESTGPFTWKDRSH